MNLLKRILTSSAFNWVTLWFALTIGIATALDLLRHYGVISTPENRVEHALVVPDLWIDPETQCQYFLVPGGITPRLGTDNFPLCANQIPVGAE